MNKETNKVTVRLNQQQLALLDNLKGSGKFGNSHEEVILTAFRLYIDQTINRSQP